MGDKVNESQSFVQEDSFKDNYMQSGNTSALSSGTSKAKTIIPKVTIPYGEEEGGLKEKFKALKEALKADAENYDDIFSRRSAFHKHAKAGDGFESTESDEEIRAGYKKSGIKMMAESDTEPELPQEEMSMFALVGSKNTAGASHLAFLNYSERVINDKREAIIGHHKNDSDYKKVITAVKLLCDKLSSPVRVTDDKMVLEEEIKSVSAKYDDTSAILEEYLNKKGSAVTPSGRKRLAYIEAYRSVLQNDKRNFAFLLTDISVDDAKKATNYNDLIYQFGQRQLQAEQEAMAAKAEEDKAKAEEDKESVADLPSEQSIGHAKTLYNIFKKDNDKEEDLLTILITVFRNNPIKKSKDESVDPEEAAYGFLAAFIENNPYIPALAQDLNPNTLNEGIMGKFVSTSDAIKKFNFLQTAAEVFTSNSTSATLLMYFMQFVAGDASKDIDMDGPPEDEK